MLQAKITPSSEAESTAAAESSMPETVAEGAAAENVAAERHPVLFVGAGPGDPDLITVRGMRALQQAEVVLWAGSLVPREVVDWAGEDALVLDSAGLSLAEQVAVMANGYRDGKRVVRLHTGDPALFGATAEQWECLDEEGVPYEVVPGVSSLFAAAAALPAELTVPGVSQAVIICRAPGRTPVPPGQDIASLASHGATLAIFLSAGLGEQVAAELAAGYPADTPVAVVQRASWSSQRVVWATISTVAETIKRQGIDRTAIVLVGPALAGAQGRRSHLYDAAFTHGYRDAAKDGESQASAPADPLPEEV